MRTGSWFGVVLTALMFLTSQAARAGSPPFNAPPAGILPTTASLASVLARHKAAVGPYRAGGTLEQWVVEEHGLQGTERDIERGADYRDDRSFADGKLVDAWGAFGGKHWEQNYNGYTRIMATQTNRATVNDAALSAAQETPQVDVSLAGQTSGPGAAYVIRLAPPDGRLEWRFYDMSSGLLTRDEIVFPGRRLVETFDDFRSSGANTFPYHVHASDGQPANDADYRLVKFEHGVKLTDAELAVPSNRRLVVHFPDGVTRVALPAKRVGNAIIVRVTIAGRGYDFVLDSGASGIFVDPELVAKLGLPTFGQSVEKIAGTYRATTAIVPQLQIGDLQMNDVVVDSAPFAQNYSDDVKIYGVLGFDFIADAVVHIDYQHGTAEAIDPDAFKLDDLKDAIELPVMLNDQVPVTRVRVGDAISEHFMVDTGADLSVLIYSGFAAAHPKDIRDVSSGRARDVVGGYAAAEGVGGRLTMIPTQLSSFSFGRVQYLDFVVYRLIDAPSFEGEDFDGLVGAEMLQFYDVYFDYVNSRIVLTPNDLLRREGRRKAPGS